MIGDSGFSAGRPYSRVICDVVALPPEQRFVAELLKSRIEARTPPSGNADTLSVRFMLDSGIAGENATIVARDGCAAISAGRFRGLVHGAGVLLRRIRYGRETFLLDGGSLDFKPAKGYREAYFARHFHNWYHHASAEELMEYIDDLVLAGCNSFLFQYAFPQIDKSGVSEEDQRLFVGISRKVCDHIHALDCGFTTQGGGNQTRRDAPEELRAVPNSDPKRGNTGFNVCPAKPGAMEYLIAQHRRDLEDLKGALVDGFCYWPFDEGGCECEKCRPWGGNGYPKLIERLEAVNKAAFPHAKCMVSTWVFHDDDWEGLYKWLETYDGVDYVIADSHTDFPKYPLEHPVPKGIPVITFPEISMWGREWKWGAQGAIMMPRRFERLFRQAEHISAGFTFYSEGRFEDINKEVVIGLYVNPEASAEEMLRSYAAYHLPGAVPEDFVELCGLLEENHLFPGGHDRPDFSDVPEDGEELAAYRKRAEQACRIAEKIQNDIFPAFRASWRWRLVFLRAMIDREIFASRTDNPESARLYYEELKSINNGKRYTMVGGSGF